VSPDIPTLIKRHLVDPNDKNSGWSTSGLKFTHWPAKATNKFRTIKQVIVAGAFFLPEPVYEAIARAAMGMLPGDNPERPEDLAKVIRSVDQGNLFQGILRSAARLSDGGGADLVTPGDRLEEPRCRPRDAPNAIPRCPCNRVASDQGGWRDEDVRWSGNQSPTRDRVPQREGHVPGGGVGAVGNWPVEATATSLA